jgi:arginine utilization protein RocB
MEAKNLFFDALKKKYEAQIAEAKATLHTYFNSTVGIGEHSELLEEFDKHLDNLAAAEDKLESLEKNFQSYQYVDKTKSNGQAAKVRV